MGFINLFFPPGYVALWDCKTPHRPTDDSVSFCLETSLLRLPYQGGFPSLLLLSLFLSFISCPTSFWRQWAAFLGAWCPLRAFRNCFVEFAQHSNVLSMNLWGRKWSPHPIPLPFLKENFKLILEYRFILHRYISVYEQPSSFLQESLLFPRKL